MTPTQRTRLHRSADRIADAWASRRDVAPLPLRAVVRQWADNAAEMMRHHRRTK